jgi:hypothetical protein
LPCQSDGTASSAGTKASSTASTAVPDGATAINVDFTTFGSGTVAAFLEQNGLYISSYDVDITPLPHSFVAENVDIVDGALTLKITGGATSNVISAEVATSEFSLRSLRAGSGYLT